MCAGVKTSNLKSQLAGQVSSAEALWTMKTADSNLLFSTSYCPAFFKKYTQRVWLPRWCGYLQTKPPTHSYPRPMALEELMEFQLEITGLGRRKSDISALSKTIDSCPLGQFQFVRKIMKYWKPHRNMLMYVLYCAICGHAEKGAEQASFSMCV